MIGAMWNGVAGIWQQDKGISVEANNIANSSTIGHKKDEITFSDLLYAQNGVGNGVITQSVSKSFTQGQLVGTGVGTDVAIEGAGFFIVKSRENDGVYYTRAGNLVQAKDGFLETQDSYKIQGLVPQSMLISSSNLADTMFTSEYTKSMVSGNINNGTGTVYNINAKSTDYASSAKDDDIVAKGDNYKTSQSKINDIEALKADYMEKISQFLMDQSTDEVASASQISQVDFSSFSNFLSEGNVLSVTIDGRIFNVEFDSNAEISQEDMESLYSFLNDSGKSKYNLVDPNSIQSQEDIDAMPTTTPQETAAKAEAQALRDSQIAIYTNTKNLVDAMKNLADKISAKDGLTASVKDGTLVIENLVQGKEFSLSNIKLNDNSFSSSNIQEAVKGSGLAMIESAKEALKNAVEKADAKFLEITNVLEYGDLSTIGENDINVRLDVLGISDVSTSDIEISDDGFVYVKSQGHSFLVGRLSTAAFRNEQGLNAIGGNLYEKTQYSGNPFNADSMNTIQGSSVERANADYSTSLTGLMVYQRAFEASSKSITTADDFLKTAIDMIK